MRWEWRQQLCSSILVGVHLYAPIDGDVYVNLPPERYSEGKGARSFYTVYGMRTAASSWEREYQWKLKDAGFEVGRASPCAFWHWGRNIRQVVLGDDFVVTGLEEDLRYVGEIFCNTFFVKIRAVFAPSLGAQRRRRSSTGWSGGRVGR